MSSESELHGLFEADVIVLTSEIEADAVGELHPREAELVANAVDKRKREFATGRKLARRALARLGRPAAELLNGPDRAPIWPEGVRGSITHCNTRAAVAVAEPGRGLGLGIDVEHRDGLRPELWDRVLLDVELAALRAAFDEGARGRAAMAIFSAKEAFYKAQYVFSRTFLGFHAVRVELEPEAGLARGRLSCTLGRDVEPFARGCVARGRYRFDAFSTGELITAVELDGPNG